MADDRDVVFAFFAAGFGFWSFFHGFNRLRRKRLIENIPTSTIRGLAMGLVELCGEAKAKTPLKSPLTKTDCVLYIYEIEEYRRSGKSGRWVTIASGNSFFCPFLLTDGTGNAMVFPKGAEIIMPLDYEFSTRFFRTIPQGLIEFMDSNNISYRSWMGTRSLRFKERFIKEGEPVYCLGSAKSPSNVTSDYKQELTQRLKGLKRTPHKMKEVDLNKDGKIDAHEWDLAVSKVEREALEYVLNKTPKEEPVSAIIAQDNVETAFIISDHSEKELMKKLSWQCLLGIYGGALLSLAMLAYLVFRFNLIGL